MLKRMAATDTGSTLAVQDYDTIFLSGSRGQGPGIGDFAIDHEGLNDLSDDCP